MARFGVKYTEELVEEIMLRVGRGESVRSISQDKHMPARAIFYDWLNTRPDFKQRYEKARQDAAHVFAEDIIEIADNGTNDWMEKNDPDNPGYAFNGESFQRSRLRVQARQWIAARMMPRYYGDKVQNEITGDGIKIVIEGKDADL